VVGLVADSARAGSGEKYFLAASSTWAFLGALAAGFGAGGGAGSSLPHAPKATAEARRRALMLRVLLVVRSLWLIVTSIECGAQGLARRQAPCDDTPP
jgi:hypothetical protein